jgi:hypothetical protein
MTTNFVLVPDKQQVSTASKQRDYVLLDRSPSMEQRWEEALAGVNTYIRKLATSGVDTRVTVAAFDYDYQIVRRDVAPFSCTPITKDDVDLGGGTALNDAIGKLVALAKTDNPARAAIVIMTDGEENASHELTTGQAHALLTQCRLRGWQVIFLGIDHDNARLAQQYGASSHEIIATGKDGIAALMAKVAEKRAAHGKTGQAITFTAAEKKDAGGRRLLR